MAGEPRRRGKWLPPGKGRLLLLCVPLGAALCVALALAWRRGGLDGVLWLLALTAGPLLAAGLLWAALLAGASLAVRVGRWRRAHRR